MQSMGMGSCWLGLGRIKDAKATNKGNMKFIIMLSFGYPDGDNTRKSTDEFNRRSLAEIADTEDERLEAARLAPSAVNSQPWYFLHHNEFIHVYRARNKMLADMNKIDIGICLAHLYVSNPDSFCYYKDVPHEDLKEYNHINFDRLCSLWYNYNISTNK